MIFIFFFAFVLQSCLPLICSATYHPNTSMPICPESFSCLGLAPFKYPFYNANNSTECGLIKVRCSNSSVSQIQLANKSYEILARLTPDSSVWVSNTTFRNLIQNRSCEALESNFTSPNPLLYSISIGFSMNVYKCTNHSSYAYFEQQNYPSYDGCKDHRFYYKYSYNYTTVPTDLPHSCQVIKLPVKPLDGGGYYTDIFSLLSWEFALSFPLTSSCSECYKKGGQCNTLNGKFHCLNTKKAAEAAKKPRRKRILMIIEQASED